MNRRPPTDPAARGGRGRNSEAVYGTCDVQYSIANVTEIRCVLVYIWSHGATWLCQHSFGNGDTLINTHVSSIPPVLSSILCVTKFALTTLARNYRLF